MTDEQPTPAPMDDATAEDQSRLHDRLSADSLTSRRNYLRVMATVSGGLVVGSVAVSAGVLPRHGDAAAADVQPMRVADRLPRGRAVTFAYPTEHDRAIAIRLQDGTLVGYSTVCTHLACGVLWREDRGTEGELYCPCHEGAFEPREGAVVQGPPPRGLPKVLLAERADGSVWAIGTAYSDESRLHAACRELNAKDLGIRLGHVACPNSARS
ncbi:ubiquinol-cytochrome c reductase iron-sulfur subunit [Streptacidiphilus jiangxiensis]|uniref:Cytochrome bc1 complex Rieske iron-sulfur subunit n=1 Tax=Streptacidiphilus jiangxiensis TaxID=235985 RepID=A0A1H7FDN9_STRJI|nr:ubiquinol-cytochrome c reductase iron-sulfur subunit [Streptacidiphilus jiangxiensis]SEK22522.1 Rieske Fe-S protein [Streptacidiphilus jiangxiensis]